MSMLSYQADKLRKYAERLRQLANGAVNQGFPARQDLYESAAEMREAADTIENLRKQVAKCQIAELKADYDTSRHFELFGTPERAARTLFEIKCGEKSCKGCPIAEPCAECDVMLDDGEALRAALLEWLRGDA